MANSRTYYVTGKGRVKRSDDLGISWHNVSIPFYGNGVDDSPLLDVETLPSNPDVVFAVGVGVPALSQWGVFVSFNAGQTWICPTGNYKTIVTDPQENDFFFWAEVSVVDDQNIFICGSKGWVIHSSDGGHSFSKCTQIPPLASQYQKPDYKTYLQCWSLHFPTPTDGVVGLYNHVVWTDDGGVTWNNMDNFVSTNIADHVENITGIHLGKGGGVTFDIITGVTIGQCIYSSDKGLNFIYKHSFDTDGRLGGWHLTWPGAGQKQVDFSVRAQERHETSNSGVTWSIVNIVPGSLCGTYAGHFYNGPVGFFSLLGDIPQNQWGLYKTSDYSATGVLCSAEPDDMIHAVWTTLKRDTCYKLTQCDNPAVVYISNSDLDYYAKNNLIIKLCPEDQPSSTPISFPPVNPADVGQFTSENYFELSDCCSGMVYTVVGNLNAYLSPYPKSHRFPTSPFGSLCLRIAQISAAPISQVDYVMTAADVASHVAYENCDICTAQFECPPAGLQLDECTCFLVDLCVFTDQECDCEDAVPVVVAGSYPQDQCLECSKICYKLTDCQDPNRVVITDTDLSAFLGTIVKFTQFPNICWIVENSNSCVGNVPVPIPLAPFDTCELCLVPDPVPPTPEEPPYVYPRPLPEPPPLNYRRVKPGYNTPGCPPEYTEKVNCRWANIVENEMMVRRYGITPCCKEDESTKWNMKKMLLDLNAIYDPALCANILPECDPCPVEPPPDPQEVLPCAEPTGITAEVIEPPCDLSNLEVTLQTEPCELPVDAQIRYII